MITLKNICKSYRRDGEDIPILQDVSFTINEGDMIAIMGKSGSGKSTLLHILGTLDKPTTGEYWFHNKDITHLTEAGLSRFRNQSIGFVFQSYFLLSNKDAMDNVALPLLYSDQIQSDAYTLAKNILEKVKMGDRIHHKPAALSGGQCQRVAIARALVSQPSIILADEPTGALDSATSRDIMDLFHTLNHEGQTIIMVTHDEQISRECNRCIHLVDGQIKDV